MTCKGRVAGGVVVLYKPNVLPEGAEVRISLVRGKGKHKKEARDMAPENAWDALLKLAGTVRDLPADMARNHDHYLYGTPKR